MTPAAPRLLSWDWREQPPMDQLRAHLAAITGGVVRLYEVDTGSDQFAIALADRDLDDAEVAELWRKRWESEE